MPCALPCSRYLGTTLQNINWTHAFGRRKGRWPAWCYLVALFAGFVLLVYVPTDLLLRAIAR